MRGLVIVAALWACGGESHTPGQLASRGQCELYARHVLAIADPAIRDAATKLGRDKPSQQDLELCTKRMTADEIACALRATSTQDVLACKPSVDPRPAALHYTPEECERYRKQLRDISLAHGDGTPERALISDNFGLAGKRECEHWLTRERFTCVLAATTLEQIVACPP